MQQRSILCPHCNRKLSGPVDKIRCGDSQASRGPPDQPAESGGLAPRLASLALESCWSESPVQERQLSVAEGGLWLFTPPKALKLSGSVRRPSAGLLHASILKKAGTREGLKRMVGTTESDIQERKMPSSSNRSIVRRSRPARNVRRKKWRCGQSSSLLGKIVSTPPLPTELPMPDTAHP